MSNRAVALTEIGRLKDSEEAMDYYNEAIDDCKEALNINPNSASALNNRALAFLEIGKLKGGEGAIDCFEKAISEFENALGNDPELAEALYNNGVAHLLLGKINANKEANDYFEEAIKLFDRSYQKAKSDFIKSKALIGKSEALSELAMLRDRKKPEDDFKRAIDASYDAIKINSNSFLAWNKRGIALYKLGVLNKDGRLLENAIKAFDNAITYDVNKDDYTKNLSNKGHAFMDLGKLKSGKYAEDNFKSAIDIFTDLIKINPDDNNAKEALDTAEKLKIKSKEQNN